MSKLALVTGASGGLGKALCEALAKQDFSLILVSRDEEKMRSLAAALSVPTEIHVEDLTQPEARKRLIALLHRKEPDLIINNAGFGLYGPVLSHPLLDMQQMVQLNAQAVMELTIEGARMMVKKGKGTIVNISSAAAFFSYPTFCVYAATKAFVNHFSEGLDTELKPQGVRVLTVCPGQIETSFRKRASKDFPQQRDRMTMRVEDAAEMILRCIEKGKSVSIIDWRYRFLVAFSRLVPKPLLQAYLKHSLKKRHTCR